MNQQDKQQPSRQGGGQPKPGQSGQQPGQGGQRPGQDDQQIPGNRASVPDKMINRSLDRAANAEARIRHLRSLTRLLPGCFLAALPLIAHGRSIMPKPSGHLSSTKVPDRLVFPSLGVAFRRS